MAGVVLCLIADVTDINDEIVILSTRKHHGFYRRYLDNGLFDYLEITKIIGIELSLYNYL
jgi:hypothetical protein